MRRRSVCVDYVSGLQIKRASHTQAAAIYDMRVDLRRSYVFVPEQFLQSANVVTGFQKMRGKTVAKCMRTCSFRN